MTRKTSVNPFAKDIGLKTEVHSSKETTRVPITRALLFAAH